MWQSTKNWFKKNKAYLISLLSISVGIGLTLAAICFFFPAVLMAISTFTLFTLAPFAFLSAVQLPIALLSLGAIATGISFGAIILGTLLVKQLTTIGKHVMALFVKNETELSLNPQASPYLNNDLRSSSSDSFDEDEHDEEFCQNDISSSSDKDDEPEESETEIIKANDAPIGAGFAP